MQQKGADQRSRSFFVVLGFRVVATQRFETAKSVALREAMRRSSCGDVDPSARSSCYAPTYWDAQGIAAVPRNFVRAERDSAACLALFRSVPAARFHSSPAITHRSLSSLWLCVSCASPAIAYQLDMIRTNAASAL